MRSATSIGFPSLASTSAEQGRLAACHAFGLETNSSPALLPFGIYSIPEISYVGRTERELTDEAIPYEVGIAHYRELARGQILGESHGVVKLLVSADDRTLLGVHAFGAGATEVVHIGQAVMGLGGTVDYLVDTGLQLPDARRGLQGGGTRRGEQAARRHSRLKTGLVENSPVAATREVQLHTVAVRY